MLNKIYRNFIQEQLLHQNTDIMSQKALDEFVDYLKKHSRCIELLSIMGDYDFTLVLIAKDGNELEKISTEIRQKFKDLIDEWRSNIVLKAHKFEEYLLN